MCLYGADQTVLNLSSRIVFVVQDAEFGVTAFTVQVEVSFCIFIEIYTPTDQFLDLLWSITDNLFDGSPVAQPVTRDHGVLNVLVEVVNKQVGNRRYASLGKIRICFFEAGFADEGYFSFMCHFQGKTHSGDTGTNN